MITAPVLRHTAASVVRLLFAGLLLTMWAGQPAALYSAPAATAWYVAPGGSDSNACTSAAQPCEHVQAAIDKAASGDTINIVAGTYIEQLTITDKNLTLKGQGAASTFLDGSQATSSILSIYRTSAPNVTVNISGITLQNGDISGAGGAIAIEANCSLTMSDSVITGNTTASSGGGISNQGVLKLVNVAVRANRASIDGGGIYNIGYLELSNVLLTDNTAPSGGGISNRNTVTVTASSIISNTSNGLGGGGIYNPLGSLVLRNSTLSGNSAAVGNGGAIYNNDILSSTKTTILQNRAANSGGGIYNDIASKTTLAGNVVQNNTSLLGGGLFNSGSAQLDGSSITNNNASTTGGGLNNTGALTMTNVTVSGNNGPTGSGISNGGALLMQFSTISQNSIQAGGSITASNSILDNACTTPIASADYNIDTGTACGFGGPNDLPSTTQQQLGLELLQDNGGGTLTRAIDFSSVAVDSADDGVCPPADQRGVHRPQGDHCDRGAYEVVGYSKIAGSTIGGGACVTSTLPIADKYSVGRMLVGVNLNYAERSDLKIRLLSPGSPRVTVLAPAASSGANLDAMFDDSATTGVPSGLQITDPPYYGGPYKPSTPLAQMRGTDIQGDWKLEICSSSNAFGLLNRWVLVVPEVSNLKIYLPMIRR